MERSLILSQPFSLKIAAVLAAAFAVAVILHNETDRPAPSAEVARRTGPMTLAEAMRPVGTPPAALPAQPGKVRPPLPARKVLDELFALRGTDPGAQLLLVGELVDLGDDAVPHIAEAYARTDNKTLRNALSDALARIGSRPAVELLIAQAADEPTPAARADLLKAFHGLSDPEGLRVLATGLTVFDDPVVRQSAAHAISQRAQPDTVRYLEQIYRETSAPNKKVMLAALAEVRNPAAVPGLAQTLQKPADTLVLEAAASSLAKIGTPAAIQAVLDALKQPALNKPSELRKKVLDSLAQVQNRSSIDFLEQSIVQDNLPTDTVAALTAARKRLE